MQETWVRSLVWEEESHVPGINQVWEPQQLRLRSGVSRDCNAEPTAPTAATEAGIPTARAPQQEKSPGSKENPAQTQINN